MTNLLFLASENVDGTGAQELARQALQDLERLSGLVATLLDVKAKAKVDQKQV